MIRLLPILLTMAAALSAHSTIHVLCEDNTPEEIALKIAHRKDQYLITNTAARAVMVKAPKHQLIGKMRVVIIRERTTVLLRYEGRGHWSYALESQP